MVAPEKLAATLPNGSTFSVIWDTGASISVSPDRADFTDYQPAPKSYKLKGIAKGLTVQGYGTLQWSMLDERGQLRHLTLKGLHVEECKS